MYSMEEWCKSNGIPLTEEEVIASLYLRSRGAKFLIDYGYENAVSRADMLFELECEKAFASGLLN